MVITSFSYKIRKKLDYGVAKKIWETLNHKSQEATPKIKDRTEHKRSSWTT